MASFPLGHFEQVHALASAGRLLAIGGARRSGTSVVTVFDAGVRKVLKQLPVPSNVTALAFNGPVLVVGCVDGKLYRFDHASGEAMSPLEAHAGGVTALSVSGSQVASTGVDGRVLVWEAANKKHELSAVGAQRAVALDVANARVAAAGDDGVVRLFALGNKSVREMAGHRGAVRALAFTPRDGRLASTGDDGTLRFWYLEGAVECEVRGEGDTGHAGGATALLFLPSPKAEVADQSDRAVSTGHDTKVRTTRLDDKKRTRTFDLPGVQRAMALVESDPRRVLADLVVAGDRRTITIISIGLDGQYAEKTDEWLDGFAAAAAQLKTAQRPAREVMVKDLSVVAETEVLPLLDALSQDREAPVRLALAKALLAKPRRETRAMLQRLVADKDGTVALAALEALTAVEEQPFSALRVGVRASVASVRIAALKALPPLYPGVPLVPGLLASALSDTDPTVRLTALSQLELVFPQGVEALSLAFDKGPPDIRAEVLVRALFSGRLGQLQSVSGRALDDDAVLVRQVAFVVRVLERPAVAAVLERMLELPEVFRRANGGKDPNPTQVAELKAKLGITTAPKELSQDDLTPLLVAMSAKSTDIASRGAAGLLFAANDVRAIAALLQLSREEPAGHRVWVTYTLGQLSDVRARQRVLSMVDDPEASVRAAAAEVLSKRKDLEPLEVTAALLRSAFEDMRKRGLSRLVALPANERGDEAEVLLGHALEDEAASVRAEAFKTLWLWHGEDVTAAIARASSARFPDLRLQAVQQLALIAKAPTDDEQPPPKVAPAAWVLERLERAIGDRDGSVGQAAMTVLARLLGKQAAKPWLKGLESPAPATRVVAARAASRVAASPEAEQLRSPLVKALADIWVPARLVALESLDALVKDDVGPLTAGLLSDSLEVRVRAAELLAKRGDERVIEPMRGFVLDADLKLRHPPAFLEPLRTRAVGALATLGSPRTAGLFADPLLKDENAALREQAARGLCNSGAEGLLLDALDHADVAVRSWAAEGLARLGDERGLPVLTGTLKDSHLPIREGALRALVALGPAGDNALFLGLDDADSFLSDTFFATLLARDLRAARDGNEPELLTAALSARRPDVRFAAARALELRSDVSAYTELVIGAVSPARPEKAGDMKDWPDEAERERVAMRLVQLLAADTPAARYLAGQALLLRRKPLEFFEEVKRVATLRPASETVVPDTNQRGRASTDAVAKRDWLRKLFAGASTKVAAPTAKDIEVHRWLAFGAYVGLVRLSSSDETVRRVRRDCVDRMIEMAGSGSPKPASVVPALVRALDDDDALVRKKAMAGLSTLLATTPDVPLRHALGSSSADVGLLALEQLASRGEAARTWFIEALGSRVAEVRQQAFVLLERSFGPGSLDALMAALASPHADLRLGVLQKLAASQDTRVTPALRKALESDRDDVRLLAAKLLAERKDDSAVPALAAFLVLDGPSIDDARASLAACATDAAAMALVNHLVELAAIPVSAEPVKAAAVPAGPRFDPDIESLLRAGNLIEAIKIYRERSGQGLRESKEALEKWRDVAPASGGGRDAAVVSGLKRAAIGALASTRRAVGLEPLLSLLEDPVAEVRLGAFSGALVLSNHRRPPKGAVSRELEREEKRYPRNSAAVVQTLTAASRSKDPALRLAAAREADVGAERELDGLLVSLFSDRDVATRVQAVSSYSTRVEKAGAHVGPLEQVVAAGNRELLLSAAEGLASKQHLAALRPLLLFSRAGEVDEQVRAVLALGAGGQIRALEELELLAAGGTEEAPAAPEVRSAAIEALGRLYRSLTEADVKKRVYETVEAAALEGSHRLAGVRALRFVPEDRALHRLQLLAGGDDADPGEPREALIPRGGDISWVQRHASAGSSLRLAAIDALRELKDPSSESVLSACLKNATLAPAALAALEACFPNDPLRVALSAASSDIASISGPALAYLLAEADPAPLLERLANPRLAPALRSQVKFGLGRRPSLPTAALVKFTGSQFPIVREDMAWLMARHALGGAVPAAEKDQRVQALVAAATSTAERWGKSVGSDKEAEERAFLRLLWAATLHEARKVDELAAKTLTGTTPAPASVRAEAARVLSLAGAGAAPVLTRAAGDVDGAVRRAAIAGLSQAQGLSLMESQKPLDALAFDSLKADAQALASEAARAVMLPKLIASKETAALMQRAEKGEGDAQLVALAALGRMGGADVAAFLAKLAFSAGGGERNDDDGDEEEADGDDDGDDQGDDDDSGPSPDLSMPGSRRFEFEEDGSSKFWEVLVTGTTCTVRFGKIGTAGQKKPKVLASADAAQKEMDRLVREKTGKGYQEVKLRGAAPPKAVAASSPSKPVASAAATEPWGTEALRQAAFRALRRAQRTNARRENAPTWFTPDQLARLETDPALAESMMPPPPTRKARDDDDDDDSDEDEDDDEDFDDDEGDDDE